MDIKIPLVKIPLAVIDSIDIGKQLNYQTNGLTVISNNINIVPRDTAGNVMLREDATDNPLLIIEPTTKKITTKSILRVIDTQFKYFKFPATTTVVEQSTELDLNLDLNLDQDIIYARYKPSENRRIPAGVVDTTFPHTGSSFSGILMDEIEDGLPQKNTNAYYITKEIKNSGKDLRIRIALQHRYDTDADYGVFGTGQAETSNVIFSLIKTNVDTGLNRAYKVYPEDTLAMSRYQVKTLLVDDVLLNSEFEIGDTFSIGAVCDVAEEFKYHTINAITSYWVTTDNSKNVDEWNQEIS
jgi:hypothetical protein